jgi:thiosulfate reductase cytochrome b subunit
MVIGFILVIMAIGYLLMIGLSGLFKKRVPPPSKAYMEKLRHRPLSDKEYQDVVDWYAKYY